MLTSEQAESLKLGILLTDGNLLKVESAFEWISDNTTLEIDITDIDALEALPASVRLFIVRFVEIMSMGAGVQSESAEGLSQSFSSTDKGTLIWQYAEELLGKWLKSSVRFVTAEKRW